MANMDRLKERCKAIEVRVYTVRDEGQTQALEKVTQALANLETEVSDNGSVETSKKAQSFLNACLPDSVGAVDSRFQSMVLGCALDDQKEVRRRLQVLVTQFCPQAHFEFSNNSSSSSQQCNPTQSRNGAEKQCSNSLKEHTQSASHQSSCEADCMRMGPDTQADDGASQICSNSALFVMSANNKETNFEHSELKNSNVSS